MNRKSSLILIYSLHKSNLYLYNINSLPNDKILDLSILKAFADNNLNVYQKLKFALERVENIVEKGENAGYQHFLLFPQCFQQTSSLGSLKVVMVWLRIKRVSFQSSTNPFPKQLILGSPN